MDTSNIHSTTVIGEDLNSVLSMFNQALQNAYDAGNWIHKYCATTHVLSHQYLDTAESIEQTCYCGSDAVQDNFDNFATSTPQKNCCGLLMPFNCMSFSPVCKLPSVSIESPQHRNESLTASTVQKSARKHSTVLTSSSVPKKPQAFKTNAPPFWIKSLHLLMSDYNALLNGSWVTDNIVNAGQIIIKYTFPHICGLQNILLLQFDVQTTEFVQILHIDVNHWITISTIGCKVGELNLYDCNQCESLSASTEEQISCLLNSKEKELHVKIMPVQRQ